jgi:LAO/AO transport system ATPase
MLDALLERFQRGDRLALSRLLSLLAHGQQVDDILRRLPAAKKPARVIAVTGSAGVGKSTLVGKLIGCLRGHGEKVAVLACDPQSPLTGGALLGDRFRMPSEVDEGIFIRSLATAGGQEAVARNVAPMVRLLEAFGFETVIVETVGAGQGDTAVRALADVVVLLVQPEMGDDIQWEKAGVLEVADIVVVQKADLPGAEAVEKQVRAALELSGHHGPSVLRASARTGLGLEELCAAIERALSAHTRSARTVEDLLPAAQRTLASWFGAAYQSDEPELKRLVERWRDGSLTAPDATVALLQILQKKQGWSG